jgi:hypothetical protein
MIDLLPATESDFNPKNDMELISRAYQVQFFENPDEDDIRKTKWLLENFRTFKNLKESFEDAQERKRIDGLDDYEISAISGSVKRLNSTDLISNIPENSIIAKENRQMNYKVYKYVVEAIVHASNNIVDKHENMIVQLLFVGERKYRYKDAVEYMRHSRRKDIFSIEATTFAEKRRKVIASLANTLLFNGTLDFVTIDYGLGRNKEGEIRFRLPSNREG